jgi:hypothetical protein
MKTIAWIGGVALVGAIALAAIVASAAQGDPIFILRVDPVKLTAPQRSCMGGWAEGVWPNITPVDIDLVNCWRGNGVYCRAFDEKTVSSAVYVKDEGAGLQVSSCGLSESGGLVTYCRDLETTLLNSAQRSALAGCINSIWSGVNLSAVREMELRRDSGIWGTMSHVTTDTAANYVQLKISGHAVSRVGTEE